LAAILSSTTTIEGVFFQARCARAARGRPLRSLGRVHWARVRWRRRALDEHRVLAATGAGLRILDTGSGLRAVLVSAAPLDCDADCAGRCGPHMAGRWGAVLLDGDRAHDFSASRCLGREITWMGRASDKDAIAVSVDGRGAHTSIP